MTNPISVNRALRDTSGALIVEAALTLPVFLFLVLGTMDLCVFLWEWNSANKAVQLGARLAAVSDPVSSSANLATVDWTGFSNLGAPCSVSTNGCPTFSPVTCTGNTGTGACAATPFNAIFTRMQTIFPGLQARYLTFTYTLNGLGFVGRPGAMPTNITVSISEPHTFIVLGPLVTFFGATALTSPPVRASATLSSEDLVTN